MRRITSAGLLSALTLVSSLAGQTAEGQQSLSVMSYNIRYDNAGDGENAWSHRKERVAGLIRFHGADLVGLQEALYGQIEGLAAELPGFGWFGVGRDDGAQAGEYSPIFYRRDRLELLEHATFWLSATPEVVGSKGWDAALPRIVTYGRLRDRATGDQFLHFNTHFDHRGEKARLESARLLRDRVAELGGDSPILVTGDFNFTDSAEGYAVLTEATDAPSRALSDAIDLTELPHYGPRATFSGFAVAGEPTDRIDYLFVKRVERVLRHGVLTDSRNGRYPSDHLPVWVEVLL